MEHTYTKAELLALDPEPYNGEIEFTEYPDYPELPQAVLWVQVGGCRYYNLRYAGGSGDGVSVHNWSDISRQEAAHGQA